MKNLIKISVITISLVISFFAGSYLSRPGYSESIHILEKHGLVTISRVETGEPTLAYFGFTGSIEELEALAKLAKHYHIEINQ